MSLLKKVKIQNDIDGMIILDKPKDYTSNDCLSIIKKYLHPKKIGHTGTLDKNATGVIVCLLGDSTRSQEYLMRYGEKIYDAELILGIETDSEDITGNVLHTDISKLDKLDIDTINETVKSFTGCYQQTPPMYSAKKINGKKLLNLAIKGITVERKPCEVYINDINVSSDIQEYISIDNKTLKKINISVSCSKGTYIRTLCKDIGSKLGIPSCMGELRRIKAGNFDIVDSITLLDFQKKVEQNDFSFIKPCFYREKPTALTFGKFETLHLGHQKILSELVNYARSHGLESTVMIVGENADNQVLTKEQRISKLKYLGVDNIVHFKLSDANKLISPTDFVNDILFTQLNVKALIVGSDCRFGYEGKGDKDLLVSICKKRDVDVKIIEKLKIVDSDIDISSTVIKNEFEKGNIDLVNQLLGK